MSDWRDAIDRQLEAQGVPAVRRLEILEEVAAYLQDRFDELRSTGQTPVEAQRILWPRIRAALRPGLHPACPAANLLHPASSIDGRRRALGARPETVTGSIRREVAAIDRDIPLYAIQTMSQYLSQNMEQPRISVVLLGGLSVLALVLAMVGIYGVVSYSVAQRTQEIGVRMALGASRRHVLQLVVGHATALVIAGVVLGILGALAVASVIRTMLYQVSERDPATFAAIAIVLVAVGVLASVIPARRASRVDPIVALRES